MLLLMVVTDMVVMDVVVTDVVVMAEVAEVAEVAEALQLVVAREGTVDFYHTHPKW